MKKLIFVLTTAILLLMTACEGSFVDPGMGTGGGAGGGSGGDIFGDWGSSGGSGGSGSQSRPATPTGVYATATSTSSITISWNSVSGASYYYIYRSTSANGSYYMAGYQASTPYTDTGLSADTTYYYKVSANNSYGEGTQSSYASARTLASSTGGGGGGSANWPTNLNGTKWKWDMFGYNFEFKTDKTFSYSGSSYPLVSAVENGRIVITYRNENETLCTSYSISGNTITLTGTSNKIFGATSITGTRQ